MGRFYTMPPDMYVHEEGVDMGKPRYGRLPVDPVREDDEVETIEEVGENPPTMRVPLVDEVDRQRRKEWEESVERRLAAMETGAKAGFLKQYPAQFYAILTGTILSVLATLGYNASAEEADILGNIITLAGPLLVTWLGAGKLTEKKVTPVDNPNLTNRQLRKGGLV